MESNRPKPPLRQRPESNESKFEEAKLDITRNAANDAGPTPRSSNPLRQRPETQTSQSEANNAGAKERSPNPLRQRPETKTPGLAANKADRVQQPAEAKLDELTNQANNADPTQQPSKVKPTNPSGDGDDAGNDNDFEDDVKDVRV